MRHMKILPMLQQLTLSRLSGARIVPGLIKKGVLMYAEQRIAAALIMISGARSHISAVTEKGEKKMKIKMLEIEATAEDLKANRVLGDVFNDALKNILAPLADSQADADDPDEDMEE